MEAPGGPQIEQQQQQQHKGVLNGLCCLGGLAGLVCFMSFFLAVGNRETSICDPNGNYSVLCLSQKGHELSADIYRCCAQAPPGFACECNGPQSIPSIKVNTDLTTYFMVGGIAGGIALILFGLLCWFGGCPERY